MTYVHAPIFEQSAIICIRNTNGSSYSTKCSPDLILRVEPGSVMTICSLCCLKNGLKDYSSFNLEYQQFWNSRYYLEWFFFLLFLTTASLWDGIRNYKQNSNRGQKILNIAHLAGRVTYNFHSFCKYMHLSFKGICNKEHNMTSLSNFSKGLILLNECLVRITCPF